MFSRPVVLSSGIEGFQHDLENGWIDYIPGGRRLVISFESAAKLPQPEDSLRAPWGLKSVQRENCSLLGVKTKSLSWYREADLHAFFRGQAFRDFCQSFDSCLFYGSSMGGYAAMAFSAAVPGSTVLAYSPQTTLRRDLVPWEMRFLLGRVQDWSGDFADACDGIHLARKVYVVYDPLFAPDARHIARLQGPNIERLRAPFAGHISMNLVKEMKGLQPLLKGALDLRTGFFPALIRDRRQSAGYCGRVGRRARNLKVKRHMFALALERAPDTINALYGLMQLDVADERFADALDRFGQLAIPKVYGDRCSAAEAGFLAARCHAALNNQPAARRTLIDTLAAAPQNPILAPALEAAMADLDEGTVQLAAAWLDEAKRLWGQTEALLSDD